MNLRWKEAILDAKSALTDIELGEDHPALNLLNSYEEFRKLAE